MTEVPATVHVPATEDVVESPQPVTRDVYATVKLDVTVDSVKLELFTGDSDLVCYNAMIFWLLLARLPGMTCRLTCTTLTYAE